MASSASAPNPNPMTTTPTPTWTYPTRFCRICREDVPPTVTMYPPGLPPYLQRPIVEYVNQDEYGRLIRPCLCRGGMRYIHELCLLRSRTENNRAGSMWKCHECGHKFNFQKLAVQRWLSSRYSSGVLTIMFMLMLMFALGFVADPIINFYADPYDTVMGRGSAWSHVRVRTPVARSAAWAQHFFKGFVSMGLVGFLKTLLLNPFQWWNLRSGGFVSSRSTSTSGRDRAVNISWIAVLIGVSSAFYFFYKWVQTIIQKTLQRVGNNIVDTQLPGDDDDLKPPPGWDSEPVPEPKDESTTTSSETSGSDAQAAHSHQSNDDDSRVRQRAAGSGDRVEQKVTVDESSTDPLSGRSLAGSWIETDGTDRSSTASGSVLNDAISQGWSFADL